MGKALNIEFSIQIGLVLLLEHLGYLFKGVLELGVFIVKQRSIGVL
jgi:hypothetical protein